MPAKQSRVHGGSTRQGLGLGGECGCLGVELEEVDERRGRGRGPAAERHEKTGDAGRAAVIVPPPYPRRAGHLPDRTLAARPRHRTAAVVDWRAMDLGAVPQLCSAWWLNGSACFFLGRREETAGETREAAGRRGARRWKEEGAKLAECATESTPASSGYARAGRARRACICMRWRKLTVRALCESAGRARVSLARSCLPGASATGRADLESRRRKLDTRAHRVRRRRSLDTVAAARAGQQACLNCRANGRWTRELRSGAPHEFQLSKRSLKTNAIRIRLQRWWLHRLSEMATSVQVR